MSRSILLFLLFLVPFFLSAQRASETYYVFKKQADSLFAAKDFKNSALIFSQAFKTFNGRAYMVDRYKAAASWAMAHQNDSAFFHLDRMESAFYSNHYEISNDWHFNPLHKDIRWYPLLEKIKQNKLFKVEKWQKSETKLNTYIMEVEIDSVHNFKPFVSIRSIKDNTKGLGTFVQFFEPLEFLGKRVRMSGLFKTRNVENSAGFWLRIDGNDPQHPLAYADTKENSMNGTKEWTRFEITVDVSEQASALVFAAVLKGTGQLWFDDLAFEIVDRETTSKNSK